MNSLNREQQNKTNTMFFQVVCCKKCKGYITATTTNSENDEVTTFEVPKCKNSSCECHCQKAINQQNKAERWEDEEPVTVYRVAYSWVKFGDKTTCAWCHKDIKEIKDPNDHVEAHDHTQKEYEDKLPQLLSDARREAIRETIDEIRGILTNRFGNYGNEERLEIFQRELNDIENRLTALTTAEESIKKLK